MYPYPLPPYYSPGMYGRSYMVPPVYPTPPVSVPIRHDTPSCSWTADTPKDVDHRDDNIAGTFLVKQTEKLMRLGKEKAYGTLWCHF